MKKKKKKKSRAWYIRFANKKERAPLPSPLACLIPSSFFIPCRFGKWYIIDHTIHLLSRGLLKIYLRFSFWKKLLLEIPNSHFYSNKFYVKNRQKKYDLIVLCRNSYITYISLYIEMVIFHCDLEFLKESLI